MSIQNIQAVVSCSDGFRFVLTNVSLKFQVDIHSECAATMVFVWDV